MSSSTAGFNHMHENATLTLRNGTTINVTLNEIDDWFFYNVSLCINYGAQLGACLVMLIVTAVLTKASKRRTPIFILNLLSLALGFLRALLLALYSVSGWVEFHVWFTSEIDGVSRNAYATSVAGAVIPLLMTITVNASLYLQAHTVCKAMQKRNRIMILAMSSLIFFLAVGFRSAQAVTNSMAITNTHKYFHNAWITVGTLATETISIWYYSVIFTGKLLYTIYARKRMGMKKWSYLEILAAMGGCTMIIPSGFAILEFAAPDSFPEAGTLALTFVALLLPLSSLWASMVTTEAASEFNVEQFWGSRGSQDPSNLEPKTFNSFSTGLSSFTILRKGSSSTQISPTTVDNVIGRASQRDSIDLEFEKMGVRVDRSYSVHSGV